MNPRLLVAVGFGLFACGGSPEVLAVRPAPPSPCASQEDPLPPPAAYGKLVVAVCAPQVAGRYMKITGGGVLTETALRADLVALHDSGLFDDISANARPAPNGVALFVEVRERPLVRKMEIEGTSSVNGTVNKASSPTGLHPGQPYDPSYAHELAENLRAMYAEQGFEEVSVTPKVTKNADGTVDVHIVVKEGSPTIVGKTSFKGNTKVSEAELRKVLELTEGTPIVPGIEEKSVLALTALYLDRGFVEVRIERTRAPRDESGKVPLVFTISEGDVFRLGKFEIRPIDDIAKKTLAKLKSKPGQIFSRSAMVADIKLVVDAYAEAGRKPGIEPETELDAKKKSVNVVIVVRD